MSPMYEESVDAYLSKRQAAQKIKDSTARDHEGASSTTRSERPSSKRPRVEENHKVNVSQNVEVDLTPAPIEENPKLVITKGWWASLKDFDGSPSEVDSIWDKRFPTTEVVDTDLRKGKDQAKVELASTKKNLIEIEEKNKHIPKLEVELNKLKIQVTTLEEYQKITEKEKKNLETNHTKVLSDLTTERSAHQVIKTELDKKIEEVEDLKEEISYQHLVGFEIRPYLRFPSCIWITIYPK
ncbi:Nuclear distribution protein nudE-like 1-B [Sesbania bispinosa]|nr:Nuclear distribution protein nudE-like 1-B [Sesbania bispinosa]